MPDTEFLGLRRVIEMTGISRSEIYRLMRAGQFPASHSYRHSTKRRFWTSNEVKAWQQQQVGDHNLELGQYDRSEFDDLLDAANTTQS